MKNMIHLFRKKSIFFFYVLKPKQKSRFFFNPYTYKNKYTTLFGYYVCRPIDVVYALTSYIPRRNKYLIHTYEFEREAYVVYYMHDPF